MVDAREIPQSAAPPRPITVPDWIPDGWTLLLSSNTAHIVSPLVLPSVPYDPVRAFTAVAAIYRYGMMLIVSPKLPVKNTAEFVAWAKAGNREVNMASQGIGSVGHMMAERFHQRAGFPRVHVPYRGVALALNDVVAGHLSLAFMSQSTAGSQLAAGKVRMEGKDYVMKDGDVVEFRHGEISKTKQ